MNVIYSLIAFHFHRVFRFRTHLQTLIVYGNYMTGLDLGKLHSAPAFGQVSSKYHVFTKIAKLRWLNLQVCTRSIQLSPTISGPNVAMIFDDMLATDGKILLAVNSLSRVMHNGLMFIFICAGIGLYFPLNGMRSAQGNSHVF